MSSHKQHGHQYTVHDFAMDSRLLVDRHEKIKRCRDKDFPAIHHINGFIQEFLGYITSRLPTGNPITMIKSATASPYGQISYEGKRTCKIFIARSNFFNQFPFSNEIGMRCKWNTKKDRPVVAALFLYNSSSRGTQRCKTPKPKSQNIRSKAFLFERPSVSLGKIQMVGRSLQDRS